ncbi:GntR family transcriptional regulator [Nocardia sp. NPDC058058]|uniref:GntR family transcriptional regulator n=1 Tax=Nocardia sp. NPDC058058 TaxID=3346317 RepID=UPI0036D9E5DD
MTTEHPKVPRYREIAEQLRAAIENGEFADGSALPSEHRLSERYGVSRGTIRQAFAFLRASGVVSSRQGARRQVLRGPRAQPMTELVSFARWARSIGETPSSSTVGTASVLPTEEVREKLGLAKGQHAFHVERVRLLSGTPTMLENTYYPERLAEPILAMDLDAESITDHLENYGIVFADAEHSIDAVAAPARTAGLLGIRTGTPLLRTIRRTTDPAGEVLECSFDTYVGSAVAFVVRNSVAAGAVSRVRSLLAT